MFLLYINHEAILKNNIYFFQFILIVFLTAFSVSNLGSTEYKIDNDHSFIAFKIGHFKVGHVLGRFNKFTGEILYNKENIENSSVSAKIDTLSIDTGVAKRDFHLRTSEFLDILKFPEITFNSKKIKLDKDNKHFLITGTLKIKNKEKDISIRAKELGKSIDPYGLERLAFKGTVELNRFDFNINFDNRLKDNSPMIGDKINVVIYLEAIKTEGKNENMY
jgi:polyisoprenoid-binding protein YceI